MMFQFNSSTMKKLLFISTLLFSSQLFAIPIISVLKADGGRKGYWFVSAEMGSSAGGTSGWILNCLDPGREQCRPPSGLAPPEGVSEEEFHQAQLLIEYAEDQWDSGVSGGVYAHSYISSSGMSKALVVTWWVEDRIIHIDVNRPD